MKRNYSFVVVAIVFFCLICWLMQVYIVPSLLPLGSTVQQSYSGEGSSAIIPILIFGMIQTGLSEEILFRGFLLKRLCNKLPFEQANIIQSLVFGSIHGIGFFMMTTPFKAFIIVLITALPAWIFGYLNEIKCDGSIIPSYLCHGIGNCFISLLSAFLIL
ncbi:MAG: CPBP family intramembrane glutamic endopeptidase [Erysipelotrichaceae bacterium]